VKRSSKFLPLSLSLSLSALYADALHSEEEAPVEEQE
jgi:hypothetical protein